MGCGYKGNGGKKKGQKVKYVVVVISETFFFVLVVKVEGLWNEIVIVLVYEFQVIL